MKKKLIWISGVAVLFLVIAGAYYLYGKLSRDYMPERLSVKSEENRAENAAESEALTMKEGNSLSEQKSEEDSASAPKRESTDEVEAATDSNAENIDEVEAATGSNAENADEGEADSMPEDGDENSDESEAELAPDFTAINYDGEEVKLSDYFGKPIVLNFWASWCPPCKSEMPDFDEAYGAYSDVQFLMVNMTDGSRETVESAKEHVESQGYSFPVLFDTEYSAAYAYYVTSLPTTYFIDKDGRLVAYASGMIDAETLERGIGMITE